MSECGCEWAVRRPVTISPARDMAKIAKTVVLTICNCDRHRCLTDGCQEMIDPGIGGRCRNGHRS